MDDLAVEFLLACQANLQCREPVLRDLSAALAVRPEEAFYGWMERRWRQRGSFREGKWGYFFHGYECNAWDQVDGRFLRIDFGPNGNISAFSSWGVLQFIMATKAPWPDFPNLKQHLACKPPPYDEASGSDERAGVLMEILQASGLVEVAAPDLLELERQYTSDSPEGIASLRLPESLPERTRLDIVVARRLVLSANGKTMLAQIGREVRDQQGCNSFSGSASMLCPRCSAVLRPWMREMQEQTCPLCGVVISR